MTVTSYEAKHYLLKILAVEVDCDTVPWHYSENPPVQSLVINCTTGSLKS